MAASNDRADRRGWIWAAGGLVPCAATGVTVGQGTFQASLVIDTFPDRSSQPAQPELPDGGPVIDLGSFTFTGRIQ